MHRGLTSSEHVTVEHAIKLPVSSLIIRNCVQQNCLSLSWLRNSPPLMDT